MALQPQHIDQRVTQLKREQIKRVLALCSLQQEKDKELEQEQEQNQIRKIIKTKT